MTERPILFSGAMVRAILDGRKTMTRRVAKIGARRQEPQHLKGGSFIDGQWVPCPYGQPGDRLWVKETHYRMGKWVKNGLTESGRQKCKFNAEGRSLLFPEQVENSTAPIVLPRKRTDRGWHKRPSLFMPRWASRITLEITAVRVERLSDISDADALAEGVDRTNTSISGYATERFKKLWESINGAGSWALNPRVWVVEFKKL